VISGRGPIYLHSAIAQAIRSANSGIIIAHYDPKVQGAVIVYPLHLQGATATATELIDTIQS